MISAAQRAAGVLALTLLLAPCRQAPAQSIDEGSIAEPLIEAQRSLTFEVDRGSVAAKDVAVTVFYSRNRQELNNLDTAGLSRGRPVLFVEDNHRLTAMFVFPHAFFKDDPNRQFYLRQRQIMGDGVVRYPDVDVSLIAQPFGLPGPSPIDIHPEVIPHNSCVFYRIRLSAGGTKTTTPIRSFRMPDSYNIGIVGDSFAAGEGAPDEESSIVGQTQWQSNICHRSKRSGLRRAVQSLRWSSPELAFSFASSACSGGTVRVLHDREQHGGSPCSLNDTDRPIQIPSVRRKIEQTQGHERTHLLLTSVGGNDFGFFQLIVEFFVNPKAINDDRPLFDSMVMEGADDLTQKYDTLEEFLQDQGSEFHPQVLICTYPDPTRGPFGRCGVNPTPWLPVEAAYPCAMAEVNGIVNPVSDYTLTSTIFIATLNSVVADRAAAHGWGVVDVSGRVGAHGVCECDEPFFNTAGATMVVQGDPCGAFHPNRLGYSQIYRDAAADALIQQYTEFAAGKMLMMLFGAIPLPQTCEPTLGLPPGTPPKIVAPIGMRLKRDFDLIRHQRPLPDGPFGTAIGEILRDPATLGAIRKGDHGLLKKTLDEAGDSKRTKRLINALRGKSTPLSRPAGPPVATPHIDAMKERVNKLVQSKELQEQMRKQPAVVRTTRTPEPWDAVDTEPDE